MPIGPIRGLVHGPLLAHEYDFKVPRIVVDNQRWDFTPLSMVLPDMVMLMYIILWALGLVTLLV